jgi:hypothetical protein
MTTKAINMMEHGKDHYMFDLHIKTIKCALIFTTFQLSPDATNNRLKTRDFQLNVDLNIVGE